MADPYVDPAPGRPTLAQIAESRYLAAYPGGGTPSPAGRTYVEALVRDDRVLIDARDLTPVSMGSGARNLRHLSFPAGFWLTTTAALPSEAFQLGNNEAGGYYESYGAIAPFWLPLGTRIDRIGCDLMGGAAGTSGRLGIYREIGTLEMGALMVDGGTFSSATAGLRSVVVAWTAPASGWYWVVLKREGVTGLQTTYRTARGFAVQPTPTQDGVGRGPVFQMGADGALPEVGPSVAPTSLYGPPVVQLRIAP